MKFAVVSDVHANLDALEAVFKHIGGMEVYCLGDLVDYGAEPNEVIEFLKLRGVKCIMGNHDAAAINGDTSLFNPRAAMSAMWTRTKLSKESKEYLEGLLEEMRIRVDDAEFYFTHGSPDDHLWEYIDPRSDSDLFGYFLDRLKVQTIGLGHTHIPYVWREGDRAVFNPGSVGQPRDGDWRASYALVSVEGRALEVEIKRVDYDCEKAAAKIRAAGLPEVFADRLLRGD
jgi:putative phosphoesterase